MHILRIFVTVDVPGNLPRNNELHDICTISGTWFSHRVILFYSYPSGEKVNIPYHLNSNLQSKTWPLFMAFTEYSRYLYKVFWFRYNSVSPVYLIILIVLDPSNCSFLFVLSRSKLVGILLWNHSIMKAGDKRQYSILVCLKEYYLVFYL